MSVKWVPFVAIDAKYAIAIQLLIITLNINAKTKEVD